MDLLIVGLRLARFWIILLIDTCEIVLAGMNSFVTRLASAVQINVGISSWLLHIKDAVHWQAGFATPLTA